MLMQTPDNEKERLDSLASYEILDTSSDQEYSDIVELAAEIFQTPMASICFVDSDRIWSKAKVGSYPEETPRDFSFCSRTILGSKPLTIEDTHKKTTDAETGIVSNTPSARFYMGIPLIGEEGFCLGTLCVLDVKPRKPTAFQKKALIRLAQQVVTLLELGKARLAADNQQLLIEVYKEQIASLNAEVANLSRTDELTGLWNRKSLMFELGKELSRSRRSGITFALLKLNLDKFSEVNDRHGRDYGNETLRSLSKLLLGATRDTDVCARFSGDEFMILMPNTDRSKANLVANRIKTSLRNMEGVFEPISASIGVAVVLAAQATEKDIVSLAHNCMQSAKDQGGNMVEIEAYYGA